jgi:hypothetical protein
MKPIMCSDIQTSAELHTPYVTFKKQLADGMYILFLVMALDLG